MEFVLQAFKNLEINVGDRIFFQHTDADGVLVPISGELTSITADGISIEGDMYRGDAIDADTIELVSSSAAEGV